MNLTIYCKDCGTKVKMEWRDDYTCGDDCCSESARWDLECECEYNTKYLEDLTDIDQCYEAYCKGN